MELSLEGRNGETLGTIQASTDSIDSTFMIMEE